MNIYLTSGTPDFMEKILYKYPNEKIILLNGNANSVLLHETEKKKSVFAVPRAYEVLDGTGEFEQRGYYVFHNISLTDESGLVFQQRWLANNSTLKTNDALIAYRFLKPKKDGAYIIITHWAGPASYEVWTKSAMYAEQITPLFKQSAANVNNLFNSASYISQFTAANLAR